MTEMTEDDGDVVIFERSHTSIIRGRRLSAVFWAYFFRMKSFGEFLETSLYTLFCFSTFKGKNYCCIKSK